MAQTDVSVTEFKGNATNLVKAVKQIDTATKNLDASLVSVLEHLKDIEKGLSNVKSVTNNAKSITNAITARNNTNIFDLGTQKKVVKGPSGFMGSDTGQEKAFKDYQQAVIEETREITKDIAERRKLRQQRANAETTSASAKMLRARKLEDQNTAAYQSRADKLAEAKLLNARNNQKGANLRDYGYQGARALSSISNTVSRYGVGGKLLGGVLDTASNFLKAPAAGLMSIFSNLGKAISDLGSEAVKAYSEIESIKTQLGIVYSSQTQANTAFGEISEYAVHSPFGIQQTSELAVLLKQSGVYASDLMDTLRMLGDTAGGNMEKMKRIANNYAQIVSIGKASMLDMRQFAYAGIPIFEAVSKELNVSQQELRKLISDGKVTSDIIEKVFKDLTGINGIFENATEIGAKTLKARLQNLADAKQLAFSSMGELLYKTGTYSGNDSYGNQMLSLAEKIWQHIHDNVNTVNIEASVKAIEERENRISELEGLKERYKDDPRITKLLDIALKTETAKRNVESDRAAYEASYKLKESRRESLANFKSEFGEFEFNDKDIGNIVTVLKNGKEWYQALKAEQTKFLGPLAIGKVSSIKKSANKLGYNVEELLDLNLTTEEIEAFTEGLKNANKALKENNDFTEKERQRHGETMLINAQNLASDQINKSADNANSLTSSFQELTEIYKNSDEYKEKQEKERQKKLEEALIELKKIADNTDNDVVDVTKFNSSELLNYFEQGAFTVGRKLQVVEGDKVSEEQASKDRALLMKQYSYFFKDVQEEFEKSNNFGIKMTDYGFNEDVLQRLNKMSNADFFKEFQKYYNEQNAMLQEAAAGSRSEQQKTMLSTWLKLMPMLLNEIGVDTTGTNVTSSMLSSAGQEFIPLWKRILAQYTGLTAQGMTTTYDTMKNYQNDMAIRNMASNVLKATFSSVGLSTTMGLVRSNEIKQLRGDTGGTYQLNWQETKKALHDFSMQLSASTNVIAAYKKGLEDELATYQELIAAGYTQAESQDIKNQKTISTKKMSQLVMDAGEQLVNAFGEEFITASGKKAYLRDDGLFYDEKGLQVQEEELRLTGNLFKMIETRLGQLYSEIHEANAQQLNNEAISKMLSQITPSAYMSRVLQMGTSPEHIAFLGSNSDYIEKFVKSKIDELKASDKYKNTKLGGMANDDIIMRALNASEEMKSLYERRIALEERYQRALNDETGVYNPELDLSLIENQIAQLDIELSQFGSEGEETTTAIRLLNDVFKALDENVSNLTDNNAYALLVQQIKNLPRTNALNAAVQNMLGAYGLDNIPESKQNTPENYEGPRGERNWALKALGWNTDPFDKEDLYLALAQAGFFRDANGNNKFIDQQTNKSLIPEGIKPEDFVDMLQDADKKAADMAYQFEKMNKTIKDMAAGLLNAVNDFSQGAWLAPFEQLGDYLVTGEDYAQGLQEKMKGLGAEMISQMGNYMAQAGFSLVTMGAQSGSWATIGAGLALAAAGGFASGLGGALREGEKNKDKSSKEAQKIENLKNDLQKLLEQARTDALYYENNLRHKNALGTNREFSYKSVHDAVITPQGNVVTTDPKDYLIATKTPQNFVGGGNVTVSPVINCNVVNNSSAQVRTEQTQNPDGSIDIITIIEEVAGGYISSPRSDGAFEARNIRMRGNQSIM